MIEIKPIIDKEQHEIACLFCDLEYKDDMLCYCAIDSEKILAVCQFSIKSSSAYIEDIKQSKEEDNYDESLLFLLGRAVMNFINFCNVKNISLSNKYKELATKLGFSEKENAFYINLSQF